MNKSTDNFTSDIYNSTLVFIGFFSVCANSCQRFVVKCLKVSIGELRQAPEGIIIIMWFYTLLMSPTYPQEAQVYTQTAAAEQRVWF